MKACILRAPAPVETNPLEFADVPDPTPGPGEVLVRVKMCGVCRTDLHVVEGELPPRKSPVIPGPSSGGGRRKTGRERALHTGRTRGDSLAPRTDRTCEFCRAGGKSVRSSDVYRLHGGWRLRRIRRRAARRSSIRFRTNLSRRPSRAAAVRRDHRLPLPAPFRNRAAAGGWRFYGFGAAAHVAIQVARHWGAEVYACTRGAKHQQLALQLGAVWAGEAADEPPEKLDAGIVFAPAGELVPPALKALKKGGVLVLGGIHMSPIPSFDTICCIRSA